MCWLILRTVQDGEDVNECVAVDFAMTAEVDEDQKKGDQSQGVVAKLGQKLSR